MFFRYFKILLPAFVFAFAIFFIYWHYIGFSSVIDKKYSIINDSSGGNQIKNPSVESKGLISSWDDFQKAAKLASLDDKEFSHEYVYIAANTDLDPALAKKIVNAPGLEGVYLKIDNNISGPIHFYNCSLSGMAKSTAPCVFYKPRVQVVDNWEWCNGIDNPHTPEVEEGYWKEGCEFKNPYAWAYFGGWIILTAY